MIRRDFAGFADILVIRSSERPVVAVQTTSASNASNRRTKLEKLSAAIQWVSLGHEIWVHGWRRKSVKRGGAKYMWHANTWKAALLNGSITWDRVDE
jgi:hypothetical protein